MRLPACHPARLSLRTTGLALLIAIGACLGGCSTAPTAGVERPIELSYDGLTPLEDTLMTRVWVREGFSLAGYRKVILEGAGIRYRPVTETNASGQRNAAIRFPVSAEQKAELEALITEEFDKALDRLTLPEVSEPGPDVLLVRGFMLDVVSRIPPEAQGSSDYSLDSVGQATFVVELVDSQTGTVLVRALDTRSARAPGETEPATAAAQPHSGTGADCPLGRSSGGCTERSHRHRRTAGSLTVMIWNQRRNLSTSLSARTGLAILLSGLLLGLGGCTALPTGYSDFDPETDFSTFGTFAFLPEKTLLVASAESGQPAARADPEGRDPKGADPQRLYVHQQPGRGGISWSVSPSAARPPRAPPYSPATGDRSTWSVRPRARRS